MRRSRIVGCVAVVTAAAGVWALGRERGGTPPEPDRTTDRPAPPAPMPPPPATLAGDARVVPAAAPAATALSGRLVRPDGGPAANVEVVVSPKAGGSASRTWRAKTDEAGRFRVEGLEPGTYRVEAKGVGTDGKPVSVAQDATAGGPEGRWTLVPDATAEAPSRGGPRKVLVVDPSGRPIASGKVMLRMNAPGGRSGVFGGFIDLKDGAFTVDDAPPQPKPRWYEETGVTFEIFDVRSSDGAPAGFAAFRQGPLREAETVVRLAPEATIEGTVYGADGAPWAGVLILAFPASDLAFMVPNAHGRTTTDARGAFRVGGLSEGEYLLSVSPPGTPEGFAANPRNAPVGPITPGAEAPAASAALLPSGPGTYAAGARDVEIRFRPAARATVRVLDPRGAELEGALVTVTLFAADGKSPRGHAFGRTAADGAVTVAGIDLEATYVLAVQPPPALADALLAYTEREWRPHATEIAMKQGFSVSGVVRDLDGNPAPGAIVRFRSDDRPEAVAVAKADGSFHTYALPGGDVTLRAARPRALPSAPQGDPVTVRAGATDVVLLLPPDG